MSYANYLAHFNPNHDPSSGQFTSGPGAGAAKGAKIGTALAGGVAAGTMAVSTYSIINSLLTIGATASASAYGSAFLTGILATGGTALIGAGVGAAAGLSVKGVQAAMNAIKNARNKNASEGQ